MPFNRNFIWQALLLIAMQTPAFAQDVVCGQAATWFSCLLDTGKSVAICGSASVGTGDPVFGADSDAWLQYRSGTAGGIDLRYPDATGNLAWQQFLGGVNFKPNGDPEQITLSFITGGIRYVIEGTQQPYQGPKDYRLILTDPSTGTEQASHICLISDAYDLMPVVQVLPCDPAYSTNIARDSRCK